MTGAGTTRVTGTMTHTREHVAVGRPRARRSRARWTWPARRAINGSGGAAIRVTGTFKRTGTGANSTTAAVDNDGLVQDIELGGGGKDISTGEFSGATLKAGDLRARRGREAHQRRRDRGATVNGTVTVVAARFTGGTLGRRRRRSPGTLEWTGGKMAGPAHDEGRGAARWCSTASRRSPRAACSRTAG